jgi:carboxymethylenebutenolidase
VCFYGIPPAELAKPADIRIPFQAHFANRDDWCTPAAADALERDMKAAGRSPEVFRYEAAHGFFNERRGDVYDAACAQQAWDRMAAFLQRTL